MKRSFVRFFAGALIAMTAIFAQNFNVYSQADGDDTGTTRCRCHRFGSECLVGNAISFRPKCDGCNTSPCAEP